MHGLFLNNGVSDDHGCQIRSATAGGRLSQTGTLETIHPPVYRLLEKRCPFLQFEADGWQISASIEIDS